jgi:hypothetical protein
MTGGDNQRYLGWTLVALSAVAWSTAGFFTRLIEKDVWTILFWRGFFGGCTFALMIAVQSRGKVIGPMGASARWASSWRSIAASA